MRLLILAFGFLPMRRGIQITDEAALLPLHESTTDIWYADPEKAELVKLTPYGMPCAAAKEEPAYEWTYRVWKATHPRFLKLCDALLGLPWTNAQEWHPDEMKVQLLAVDQKPDQLVAWPSDWPKDGLSDSPVAGTISEFCVQVAEQSQRIDRCDPGSTERGMVAERCGRADRPLSWIVLPYAARIYMPGAIESVAPGPCSIAR